MPSPTFTLMQTYELPRFPVVHADLYRLDAPGELAELGFDDLPEGAVVLLEWPDRAAGFLPPDRLDIAFTLAPQLGPEHRNVRVTGYGTFAPRAERLAAIRRFLRLERLRRGRAQPHPGRRLDALLRAAARSATSRAILMNAPRRPDGPPVRDGKPYSAIVHLAEDVKPFVAMANGLRQLGLLGAADLRSRSRRRAADHRGPRRRTGGRGRSAGADRGALRRRGRRAGWRCTPAGACRTRCRSRRTSQHVLPRYDIDALLIEAELLLDWYLPSLGAKVSDATRTVFVAMWREVLQPAIETDLTWVLRDFHSPNLMWLPDREGVARVGLLDFQDAVIGPAAYDLASLLQDARVDVPEDARGRAARPLRAGSAATADPDFDPPTFIQTYATMAAQRASKILGIFARLDRRDGKPQYLRHIPAGMGLSATLAGASVAGDAERLVQRPCAQAWRIVMPVAGPR